MNHFRVFYTDGTSYDTNANGTRKEFEDYLMKFGGVVTDENPVTGEETKRQISGVIQIFDYGFLVKSEERKQENTAFYEDETGTVFVEVSTYPRADGKIQANLYYKSHVAKWNATTEQELIARFPKSFAKNDVGEEYEKLRQGTF